MSSSPFSPTLRRILLEALLICSLSVTVGLSLNYRMVLDAFTGKAMGAPTESQAQRVPEPAAESRPALRFPDPVALEELDELQTSGALLVDARSSSAYVQQHLKGAVSLPLGEVDPRLTEFLANVPKDRTLITYCNGFGCPDSFDLGVRLLAAGFQQVLVFEGGLPQWRDAGRPLEGTEK